MATTDLVGGGGRVTRFGGGEQIGLCTGGAAVMCLERAAREGDDAFVGENGIAGLVSAETGRRGLGVPELGKRCSGDKAR